MNPKKRAYVETFGCQMNISDGELMQGILAAGGYDIVASPEDADVVLVNTCAIREHAEQRVLGRVSQLAALKRDRPGLVIGVTGCMAQRMGADLLERAPYVDLVMGPDGYRGLPEALSGIDARRTSLEGPRSAKSRVQLAVLDLNLGESYEGLEQRRASDVSAWITIQRGCDHRCSFCIVPYVRGPEKNRRGEDVLAEVRAVAARGISEVTLLGQTVNSYRHEGWTFPALLRAVARVAGIRRVRFTSPHPADVNDALVEVMATEGAVCEHLHLPLQSGSDRVLKRMVRRYDVAEYMDKVAMVRAALPEVALSTDLIAGFPGETEADFDATVDVVRAVRFDEAYTYRYSPRAGTPATRMPSDWTVPDDVAQARLERLIALTRGVQAQVSRAELGRVEEVLVDRPGREPGQMIGKTRRNKVVAFDGHPDWVGGYRLVRLERTSGATFGGRVVEERARAESA